MSPLIIASMIHIDTDVMVFKLIEIVIGTVENNCVTPIIGGGG